MINPRMSMAQIQYWVCRAYPGLPYSLSDEIDYMQRQLERGRIAAVKVTPSRNKREGWYCGKNPDLFANPRHQRGQAMWGWSGTANKYGFKPLHLRK